MRDRDSIVGAMGAVVGAFGLCCGVPVLLSFGVLGALAGISVGSWALIGVGVAAVAFAVWRRQQRHRSPSCGATRDTGTGSGMTTKVRTNEGTLR